MRRLDAWAGVPLCAAASVAAWLGRLCGRRDREPHSRLLIIKLSELGANIMLGDMVRSLRRAYAKENTWFMAFAESEGILKVMDFVPSENLLLVSTKSLPRFASSLLRAIWRARRAGVDTVLDMEFFSRASALIAWLSGARRRAGIHAYFGEGAWRGQLMTHRVKFNPHLHISQMVRALGEAVLRPADELQRIEFNPPPVTRLADRFVPAAAEDAAVDALLAACGWRPGERIVLLNANTSDREIIPLRRWGEERYAEVARRVLEEFSDVRVLLTGASKEADSVAGLERRVGSPRCVSVAGKTSLRELLALYTRAVALVTNDSGPGHFAALTDIAVVVLFGPETPQLWRPLGREVRVVYRGLACSPCFSVYNGRQSGCRKNTCMDIDPREVVRHVCELLAGAMQ
jgi:ADP-heptose:LPS heptosyltransferase